MTDVSKSKDNQKIGGGMMQSYEELVELGLNGLEPLKIILKGYVADSLGGALVFASSDKEKAKAELERHILGSL